MKKISKRIIANQIKHTNLIWVTLYKIRENYSTKAISMCLAKDRVSYGKNL